MQAVASLGPDDAWAVGETGVAPQLHSLVLHWDGAAWTRKTTPDLRGLVAIASAAGILWVAGEQRIMHRPAGGDWDVLPSLPVSGAPGALQLLGVAASGGLTWAVGTVAREFGETIVFSPYAAFWDSKKWHEILVDEAGTELTGVTAGADGAVFASSFDGKVVRLSTGGDRREVTPSASPHAATLDAITTDPAGRPWSVGAVYEDDGSTVPWLLNAPGIDQGGIRVTTGYGQATVSWFGPVDGSGLADVYGMFAVGGLPDGSYFVTASGAGCTPGQADVKVRAGRVTAVTAMVEC